MVSNMKIGEFIRNKRKEANLSQKDLAEKLNISFQAVSKWETGETLPDAGILLELAEVLDTTTDKILSGGQLISKKNRTIQLDNILKGFDAIESIRGYLGEDSPFYEGLIEGINKKMNIDFEQYIRDDRYKESMIAEAIIQYLINGYRIDVRDIDSVIQSEKLRNLVHRYIGDENKMNYLRYDDNVGLFEQIRKIRPEFENLDRLNELPGEYIRMEPGKTYWGTQVETNQDFCYGIAVDEKKIHVFTYGMYGVDQKLVHEELIEKQ